MAMRKRDDDLVFPNAAGIDVGGSSHWVAVPRHTCDDPVREFGAMTDDLNAMADWLLACGVDTVALESTGVYWIPVYEVLEQRGLKVFLVDARQMKYVPGRKSDVQDCQWLQRLMSQGYLRAAFRPGERGLRGARGGTPARRAAGRAGQLGAAHAKGAGADEHPAHRGAQRRDGRDRSGHHPRHRGRRARRQGAGAPPQRARQGQRARHRQGVDGQLARRAPVRAAPGAVDVRRYRPAPERVRRQAARAAEPNSAQPRSIWARRRARAARRARSSIRARFWPTGPASISRASTGWGWRR